MKKIKQAEEEVMIKFLLEHKEIKPYISLFSVAEIVANMRNEFKDLIQMEDIKELIEILRNMISIDVIKLDETENSSGIKRKGILISDEIIKFAYFCYSARDSIHIDMAKSNDLLLVTRDDDIPRVKELYPKIIGESKFRKQF